MTTTRSDLLELFRSLTHDQQRTLRGLLIWYDEKSGWLVRCSYASCRTPQEHLQPGAPTFAPGRLADTEHRLTLDADDPGADVAAMCRALVAIGTVGSLAVVRYDHTMPSEAGDSWCPMWMIVTHAGSDQERATWLHGLSEGGIPPAAASSV